MSFKEISANEFRPFTRGRQFNFKGGWRIIGDQRIFARSRWESNFARYLQFLKSCGSIKEWAHEPKTFWFEGIRRGVTNYKPDFRITDNFGQEKWVEVKGFMDKKSATKVKRMKKYFPQVKLSIVDKKWFKRNETFCIRNIKDWER